MKKSIIKQVFHGFRGTAEVIKKTGEEYKLFTAVSDTYDELIKELTPNQLKLHETFNEAREDAYSEESNNLYVEGFKLGLLIGIECMED